MKLTSKILLPVVVLSIVSAAIWGASAWGLARITTANQALIQTDRMVLTASELRSLSRALQRDALNLIAEDTASQAAMNTRFDARLAEMAATSRQLDQLLADSGTQAAGRIGPLQDKVMAALAKTRDLAIAGQREAAAALFRSELREGERAASALTDPIIESGTQEIARLTEEVGKTEGLARTVATAVGLIGILAGALLSWMIARRSVVQPLARLTESMGRLAGKDYAVDLSDAARTDEIETVRDIERRSAARFLGTDRAELADDEPTAAAVLARRIEAGGLLVAGDGGTPVAFVMFRPEEGCAYVEQIDVLPSHARRGIGARLLEAVAQLARERGLAALTLSTFKDVPFNAPYYARLGFAVVEELTPGMAAIRAEHEARGLDETARVFMRREA